MGCPSGPGPAAGSLSAHYWPAATHGRAPIAADPRIGLVLRWQRYEVRDHVQTGATVATRIDWSGELAIDVRGWPAGTILRAHCVAHYDVHDGRIARIEQHDCYESPTGQPLA